MNKLQFHFVSKLSWRWWGALTLFSFAFLGFLSGVEVSDRFGLPESNIFTIAYYSLGLFVLGGLDLGTPIGGPLYGRILLWTAYFGAPLLTASALIESLVQSLQPQSWRLRRLKNHILIMGSNSLTFSIVKKIREQDKRTPILVIADEDNQSRLEELQSFGRLKIIISVGDQRFIMQRLRIDRAHRVMFLLDNDIINCEGATALIEGVPVLANRVIYHVADLRLFHMLKDSRINRECVSFNSYQMAASHIATQMLIKQFKSTEYMDTVVLAGFGRFGQSLLEQLERHAMGEFSTVGIIDNQAKRNTLIFDDQIGASKPYIRHIVEGDIDDPVVWNEFLDLMIITNESPVFILSTGNDEINLRVAIWLRKKYVDALIIARSSWPSAFARNICKEHNIININITELMEDAIPEKWYID